ncbi:flagellar hook-associated protein 1 FlgK [Halanaerobium saccharolyticum]|uniref:Flagellar hook-associated protein 1 n=1 Tax=Halanaerobium saccharolyticum TaxID=43595 RepID=A0A4R7Z6Z3_9FIRM|nr:flagellar hook-associated protein FlgK [Halanaerobium saccharolyticum]RAK08589.1 flagellar hook-associated protein 1 FlgK [Halanaerobium saccharolyticum]TDW07267.1 flagellar hook-associated protein 1 FlgK [Halanaerobium saccharolyticum]TDX60141.1 flagellar hook-associated protein 1 FlgK [Halanaerobium saccharolyticum]
MNNIFSGLHVGLRALETQRKSLDVTGHNIANANNENYNKQRAIHKASYPYTAPGLSNHGGAGQFGTGVEIEQVERVKDQFINSQIFNETQTSGYWEEMQRGLEKVEYILNEPSDSGIDSSINQFWNSLQDLSNNPSDDAARNMVRENAYNVIDSFKSVENQLNDYKESINDNLSNAAADINNITNKMADLNKQIVSVKGSGQNPNDLLDERDALYKDLSELINVQSREDAQGNLVVSTQGLQLVNGSDAYELETKGNTDDNSIPRMEDQLIHSRTGTEIKPTNGKIAAWMEMRDEKLDFYAGRLDKLAETMVTEFNNQHQAGYDANGVDGGNFFEPIDNSSNQSVIAQLDLTAAIKDLENGLDKIAAGNKNIDTFVELDTLGNNLSGNYQIEVTENTSNSDQLDIVINDTDGNEVYSDTGINVDETINLSVEADGGISVDTDPAVDAINDFTLTLNKEGKRNITLDKSIGNGENANALANIFNSDEVIEGASLEGYFRTIVTSVGAESSRSQQMKNNQDVVLKQLTTLDRSISGVSLDEEMANLIKYQQSYAAAAKYINKTEELLDSLMTIV